MEDQYLVRLPDNAELVGHRGKVTVSYTSTPPIELDGPQWDSLWRILDASDAWRLWHQRAFNCDHRTSNWQLEVCHQGRKLVCQARDANLLGVAEMLEYFQSVKDRQTHRLVELATLTEKICSPLSEKAPPSSLLALLANPELDYPFHLAHRLGPDCLPDFYQLIETPGVDHFRAGRTLIAMLAVWPEKLPGAPSVPTPGRFPGQLAWALTEVAKRLGDVGALQGEPPPPVPVGWVPDQTPSIGTIAVNILHRVRSDARWLTDDSLSQVRYKLGTGLTKQYFDPDVKRWEDTDSIHLGRIPVDYLQAMIDCLDRAMAAPTEGENRLAEMVEFYDRLDHLTLHGEVSLRQLYISGLRERP